MLNFRVILNAAVLLGSVSSFRLFRNPITEDFPTTNAIKTNGYYFATVEKSNGNNHIGIYQSIDIQHWGRRSYAFSTLPEWVDSIIGGGQIIVLPNASIRLYFSAVPKKGENAVIGVATATDILGPYTADESPLVSSANSSFTDPHVFIDGSVLRLVWSVDGKYILGNELSSDGLQVTSEVPINVFTASEEWQQGAVSTPSLYHRFGWYFLFYSASSECSNRSVGVARSQAAFGPYITLDGPLINSDRVSNPSAPKIVLDIDDETEMIIYTATKKDCVGNLLMAEPLTWNNDGWPSYNSTSVPCLCFQ